MLPERFLYANERLAKDGGPAIHSFVFPEKCYLVYDFDAGRLCRKLNDSEVREAENEMRERGNYAEFALSGRKEIGEVEKAIELFTNPKSLHSLDVLPKVLPSLYLLLDFVLNEMQNSIKGTAEIIGDSDSQTITE